MHTAVSWFSFRLTDLVGDAVRYCSSSMAASTFFCVLSVTAAVPVSTRDTVAILTPAARATSFIVDKRYSSPLACRRTRYGLIGFIIHIARCLSIEITSVFQNVKCKFT